MEDNRMEDLVKWFDAVTRAHPHDFAGVDLDEARRQMERLAKLFTTQPVAPYRESPRKPLGGGSGQGDSS